MRRHQLIALFVVALFSLSLIAAGCGGDKKAAAPAAKGEYKHLQGEQSHVA